MADGVISIGGPFLSQCILAPYLKEEVDKIEIPAGKEIKINFTPIKVEYEIVDLPTKSPADGYKERGQGREDVRGSM